MTYGFYILGSHNMLIILASIGAIYSAGLALVQYDLKKVIALSSVSHMGLCVLVLPKLGGELLMIGHFISSSAMFLMVGLLYNRYHTRNYLYYGGLSLILPAFSSLFVGFMLVNSGLPGTINFIPEFLCFVNVFEIDHILGLCMSILILLTPCYSLLLSHRVVFGSYSKYLNYAFNDLNLLELSICCSLMFICILLGWFPLGLIHSLV